MRSSYRFPVENKRRFQDALRHLNLQFLKIDVVIIVFMSPVFLSPICFNFKNSPHSV